MITIDDLSKISLLKQLPSLDLDAILPHLHVREFQKDTTILHRGDPGCSLFMILKGSLAVTLINYEGVEYLVNTIHEGDVFGEMALLTGEPRSANVKAATDVILVELYQDAFNGLIASHPLLRSGLFRLLMQRMGMNSTQANTGITDDNKSIAAILSIQTLPEVDHLFGKTKWALETNATISLLAKCDANVLILGERGTGKDLAARLIHYQQKKHARPLLHLDCAHPPPVQRDGLSGVKGNLHLAIAQEAALFGHGADMDGDVQVVRKGYLELADSGTLILENIEYLTPRAQRLLSAYIKEGHFLRRGETQRVTSSVRIIATAITLKKTETKDSDSGFSPELVSLLSAESISMKPLRERKKDIPAIANCQLELFNRKFNRQVSSFSNDAMNAMVDHEWPLNIEELRQVVERAVAVSDGETITQRQLFLNSNSLTTAGKFNLLSIPSLRLFFSHPLTPNALRYITAPFMLTLILSTLLGPKTENPANIIVWGVWWPFLVASIVFSARSWCGYCPMPVISDIVTPLKKDSVVMPGFISRNSIWIGFVGFTLILLAEHSSHMFTLGRPTGFLLLTILLGTIITNFFFGTRSWCKHLCPLGMMVSHSSALSLIELGSNSNVCSSQCQTHDCVKDRNCPMGLHPSAATTSKDCVLCLSCIKSCSHRSVHIDARLPWREMLTKAKGDMHGAIFGVMLTALVLAVKLPSFTPFRRITDVASNTTFVGETALSVAVLLFFSATVFVVYLFPSVHDRKRYFALVGQAWLFLGFAGFFNIYFHELVYNGHNLFGWLLKALGLGGLIPLEWITPNLGTLKILVPLITLTGAVASIVMLKKIAKINDVPQSICRAHQALISITTLALLFIL